LQIQIGQIHSSSNNRLYQQYRSLTDIDDRGRDVCFRCENGRQRADIWRGRAIGSFAATAIVPTLSAKIENPIVGTTRKTSMDTFHHVAIPVSNIAAAIDWYSEWFEIEIAYADDSWALLRFDNAALALVLPQQHPAHIGVERPDAAVYGALTSHRDGTQSVYLKDPWHNTIEILKLESAS
jgi:hypothetical protein